MGVVIGDLLLVLVLAIIIGLVVYRISRKDDTHDAEIAQAKQVKEELKAKIDAKRFEPGTPLLCLNCDHRFVGPLLDSGCPNCHKSSLVVTQEELRNAAN